jgi:enediyne biosynthesis protein E4
VPLGRVPLTWLGPWVATPRWNTGAAFAGYDLNGDLDLLAANGHVYPQIDAAGTASACAQPNHLCENQGNGRFTRLLPQPGDSLGSAGVSRGSCIGDYDNDGNLGILIAQFDAGPSLLRNDVGNQQNWNGLKLGRACNRNAIGARVRLLAGGRPQIRDAICGSSFLSSEDRRVHFGLGAGAQ